MCINSRIKPRYEIRNEAEINGKDVRNIEELEKNKKNKCKDL